MSGREDGGSAFPGKRQGIMNMTGASYEIDEPGMSLRDYFAGMALQGIMATRTDFRPEWQSEYAWRAYSMADVMLAERAKDKS